MKNDENLTWEQVYKHWYLYAGQVPDRLQKPLSVKEIPVAYDREGIFYGFDWLPQKGYEHRKHLIETNITSFLLFTQPTNKGTIHTLQMLLEAKDDEERAAIWLYAFTKDIMDTAQGSALRFAYQINDVC